MAAVVSLLCAAQHCEPWCDNPCHELKGDHHYECGGCTKGTARCHTGAKGFVHSSKVRTAAVDAHGSVDTSEGRAPAEGLVERNWGCLSVASLLRTRGYEVGDLLKAHAAESGVGYLGPCMRCWTSDESEELHHRGLPAVLEDIQTVRSLCTIAIGLPAEVSDEGPVRDEVPPPASVAELEGSIGLIGLGHCAARIRALSPAQLADASARLRKARPCALEDPTAAHASGVLLVRGALSAAARDSAVAPFNRHRAAANGTAARLRASPFLGRTSWRGSHVADVQVAAAALDALLVQWDRAGLMPPPQSALARRAAALPSPPRIVDFEYLELEAAKVRRGCPSKEWHLCVSLWHQDASVDGVDIYRIWVLLNRSEAVDAADLVALGLNASTPAREHSNIAVAPLDRVDALCAIADQLSAAEGGIRALSPQGAAAHLVAARTSLLDAGAADAEAERLAQVEVFARRRDQQALDAARCDVIADPGDLLLLRPKVFHRTQDALVDRVAMIAEADWR